MFGGTGGGKFKYYDASPKSERVSQNPWKIDHVINGHPLNRTFIVNQITKSFQGFLDNTLFYFEYYESKK